MLIWKYVKKRKCYGVRIILMWCDVFVLCGSVLEWNVGIVFCFCIIEM